ncbi:MAG: 16S rRNA (guanine(966)-N(2))-methyltransferase RsmD, partial [Phycisphaerales bacterium]
RTVFAQSRSHELLRQTPFADLPMLRLAKPSAAVDYTGRIHARSTCAASVWLRTFMRIIAGQWRSRRLIRPGTGDTRPMPDRVKEAVFNILGSHYACPGALPPLRVADVFAGSGSMGLEALSRGAASCCFFERHREALDALRQNLDALRVGVAAAIVTRDAWRWAVVDPDGRPFDLIFLDPPYRDSEDTSSQGAVRRYLARLGELEDNTPLVVLHHGARVCFETEPTEPWRVMDRRTLGGNSVTLFAR